MNIQPVNNGHVLVVPREHYESLLDVPERLECTSLRGDDATGERGRKVTGSDDLNIACEQWCGGRPGRTALSRSHYSAAVTRTGFDIPLPFNGSEMPDRTVLDAYAAQIIFGAARSHGPTRIRRLAVPSGIRTERQERSIPVPVFADSAKSDRR